VALICDTSGVYALYDVDDAQHLAATAVVEAARRLSGGASAQLYLLEGDVLRVSPALAGQYVRVEFTLPGPNVGRVLYPAPHHETMVVALFRHQLNAARGEQAGHTLTSSVQLLYGL